MTNPTRTPLSGNPIVINMGGGNVSIYIPPQVTTPPSTTVNNQTPPPPASGGGSIMVGSGGIVTVASVAVARPVASFSYVVLANGLVKFTDTSLGNPGLFAWLFGDGGTSSEQNPYHVFPGAGTYVVTLYVQNSGGIDDITQNIVVTINAPTADFTYFVGGFTTYFTNTSTWDGPMFWDFGDGQTSTDNNPKHTYAVNGSYTVTLTAGTNQATHAVTIDTEILLAWQDNSTNETGFKIYHSTVSNVGPWALIKTVGADITSYGVTNAVDGVNSSVLNYFYVTAYNSGGESAATNVVSTQCIG